jgi:hypothetical protein
MYRKVRAMWNQPGNKVLEGKRGGAHLESAQFINTVA